MSNGDVSESFLFSSWHQFGQSFTTLCFDGKYSGGKKHLSFEGEKTQRGCEASSILGRDSEMRPENPNTAER